MDQTRHRSIGRKFGPALGAFAVLSLSSPLAGPALAADALIGVAAPLTGFAAPLGNQIQAGAAAAAAGILTLVTEDTACTAEGGARAAAAFVAARVSIVTGFLCTEALEAALPVLSAANIAVITSGVRTDALTDNREKTGYLVWRTAPRMSAEAAAAAELLLPRWRAELFAIIDDGTIYGRELAEQFRLAAEEVGLKPVFTDTFRPQLSNQTALAGRLRKAGATHVFVGGDRADIAVLARDAAALGYTVEIAGGEALKAAEGEVPLAPGVLAVLPREPMLPPADAEALAEAGITVEGHVAPAFEAALLAMQVLADGLPADADAWHKRLDGQTFALPGTFLRFDEKGDFADNPFVLKRWTGEVFEDVN